MECNFCAVNLQYLLQARQAARSDPELAGIMLGIPPDLVCVIAELDDACLAQVAQIKAPLVIARGDLWWWSRLRQAFDVGNADEIEAVVDHASLATLRDPQAEQRS
jgi:hypothetical protein